MKLLAIVPCYNEEASVGSVARAVKAAYPDADVLVIDDGSADRTAEAARAAGAKVVTLPYNMGIGAAMQTGYRYARAGGYDVAVQVDGDGQHDPEEMGKLLEIVLGGKADIVVGSRFIEGAGFRSTPMRRLGIGLFSSVLTRLTGERLTDPTSGFRAAGRRVIRLFADEYPEDYPEVESLFLAHLAGLKVAETPVLMRPRAGGRSSITPVRSAYYMIKVMMVIFIWLVRKKPVLEG
ncbi:MAG: glycosyltransferase family 2 protein [Nitrospirae bacterium]|nr:glycosyltransferase family 2 protein [Nitrospirota bacterium]MBI5695200.1 glycosyltransferase family 2 protein [Nitrospirota bacterium]